VFLKPRHTVDVVDHNTGVVDRRLEIVGTSSDVLLQLARLVHLLQPLRPRDEIAVESREDAAADDLLGVVEDGSEPLLLGRASARLAGDDPPQRRERLLCGRVLRDLESLPAQQRRVASLSLRDDQRRLPQTDVARSSEVGRCAEIPQSLRDVRDSPQDRRQRCL
jgi:hypothetical protein